MGIKYSIDSREVPFSTLGIAPMNFGQPRLWDGKAQSRYTLHVPIAEMYQVLSEIYAEYRDDALQHPDEDSPLERSLSRLGWPQLNRLSAEAPDIFRDLVEYYGYDVLLAIELRHASGSFDQVIVSVDEVVCSGEGVEFAGIIVPAYN